MLQNNLDPAVAERPDDLVVYGGTGQAARSREDLKAILRTLLTLEADETLLVQSGRAVGVMRTHEWAPRVLIANSNLVPDWANWPEFRRLEALGLTMYGQMTAGSWIYIGTQGILQGTYETFAAVAEKRFGGTLEGHASRSRPGCGGMGGAQPLAVTHERRRVPHRRSRPRARLERRLRDPLPRHGRAADLDDAIAQALAAKRERHRQVDRPGRQRRRGPPRDPQAGRRGRHRHRPDLRARPAVLCAHGRLLTGTPPTTPRPTPRRTPTGPRDSMARHVEAMVGLPRRGRRGLRLRQLDPRRGPRRRLSSAPSRSPVSCPPTSGPCSAKARAPSDGPPSRGDPRRHRRHRPGRARPLPREPHPAPLDLRSRANASPSRAFRPASAGSATANATSPASASTRWSPTATLKAPIVIGRDHLDCGSVASPYRETEGMKDGSDAIADWPLLNALVNTASGAELGLDPPRRRRRHRPVDPRRAGHCGRRHADGGREARTGAGERPGDGRHPARGRRLRGGRERRRGPRRADTGQGILNRVGTACEPSANGDRHGHG